MDRKGVVKEKTLTLLKQQTAFLRIPVFWHLIALGIFCVSVMQLIEGDIFEQQSNLIIALSVVILKSVFGAYSFIAFFFPVLSGELGCYYHAHYKHYAENRLGRVQYGRASIVFGIMIGITASVPALLIGGLLLSFINLLEKY